jgi:glycosyltransferase involved in cell wall biosynthesis
VLLNGDIRYDARVTKIVRTLSSRANIDLFYVNGRQTDSSIFDGNVKLHSFQHNGSGKTRVLRNTLFYREFDYFARRVLQTGKKYDIVYANDLPTLGPAVQLKRKLGARLVYDSHEIYLETLNQFFPEKARPAKASAYTALLWFMKTSGRLAERRLLKSVDVFLTVSPSCAAHFERIYGYKPVEVVLNCPPLDSKPITPALDFREVFGWTKSDTVALYQGVLNRGRGLELLLKAMAIIDEKIKLVIIGSGMLRAELEDLVTRLKLTARVKFLGQIPQESLPTYTVAADFGINLLEDFNLSKRFALPNKLFEYMHAGIPVLGTAGPENERVFAECDMGMLVKNEVAAVAAGVTQLARSDQKDLYRRNAYQAAKKYNWQEQAKVLLRLLELE